MDPRRVGAVFADADACITPVLTFAEAPAHPHAVARGGFVEVDGVVHPAPAPRFSRSRVDVAASPTPAESQAHGILADWWVGPEPR
ncbi:hypothetical protein [Actinoalloteichus fjordicus]|uniref:hypothetical protein n=1 Tax=Actinoalloteichus fjordicus TaxID=1612552 RepID=UPI0018DC1A86|nr:hypothetical protein [Actinoalloteichus fjordicus]